MEIRRAGTLRTLEQFFDERRRKGSIFLLAFIVFAAVMVDAGYFSYQNYEQRYRREVERQLSAIADLKVKVLMQWRLERLGDGDLFFKNHAFSLLIRRFLAQPEDADVLRQLQDWIRKVQEYNRYDQVRLLDVHGTTLLSLPVDRPPMAACVQTMIPEVLRLGQVVFQDFYRSEHDQRIYLAVLVPIIDTTDGGQPLGLLELRIEPDNFLYPFLKSWPTPSQTAETLLIRREGAEAIYLNELRFLTNATLNLRVPLGQGDLIAAQAALGQVGIQEGRDYRGEPVVAALRAIPDSPWILIARMDAAEVYAPLRARFWQTIALIGALLLGAATSVGMIWRQQHARFYQERYAMTEELRTSELRYRRLFEAAKEGILIFDATTGTIIDVNPFLLELLGCSQEDCLGQSVRSLTRLKEPFANETRFAELCQREHLRFEDLTLEAADGRRLQVELISYKYQVNQRKVIQCNIRDITAAKQIAAERTQHEAQVRQLQKADSLGRMAGAIAHHFNNNLQVVTGSLELALLGLPPEEKTATLLLDAMHAAQQAAKLNGLLLTYLGQAPHETKPLDLSELCRQSLPLLRIAMPLVLETDLAASGPVIDANVNQIQQVLTNLVTNAWESGGPNRGAVRLSCKQVAAQEIPAVHRFPVDWQPQAQTYACLSVGDAGCGIAAADIEKLFDPFFSRKIFGRGLGLPVVLGIARMHNGGITVESEPGQGSIFRVYFPVVASAALPLPGRGVPPRKLVGGGTVLVVDDEEGIRNLAATMLAHLGFTVLTAADGVEAESVFRQHQSDIRCVLTDLAMPRRNGWETIAVLRALRADLPVVMASGYDVTRAMAGEHGERPQAFLSKPYTLHDLRDALGRVLAVEQSAPAPPA